jgi:hypothetical protein
MLSGSLDEQADKSTTSGTYDQRMTTLLFAETAPEPTTVDG